MNHKLIILYQTNVYKKKTYGSASDNLMTTNNILALTLEAFCR